MSAPRRPRPRARSDKDAVAASKADAYTSVSGTVAGPRASVATSRPASQVAASSSNGDSSLLTGDNSTDDFFDRSRRTSTKRIKTNSFSNGRSSSSRAGRSSGNADKQPVLSDLAQVREEAFGQAFNEGESSDNEGGPLQKIASSSDADDGSEGDDSGYDSDDAARRKRRAAQARREAMRQSMQRAGSNMERQRSHLGPGGSTSADRDGRSGSATISPVDGISSKRRFASQQVSDDDDDDDDDEEERKKRSALDKEVSMQLKLAIADMPSAKRLLKNIEKDLALDAAEVNELHELDPDLIRHLGEKAGPEARRIQRDAIMAKRAEKEKRLDEARRQQEQEQRQLRQTNGTSQQPVHAGVAALRKSPRTGQGVSSEPLELSSDTESEASRPFARTRSNRSSPGVEIVSVNKTTPRSSQARQGPAIDLAVDDDEPAPHATEAAEHMIEEEVERIAIVMKGGEQGALVSHVQARPTTTVAKLVAHFVAAHKDAIPSNKIRSVKMRFDGDVLADTSTMEDIGIDDEEQLDVIW